MGAAPWLCLLCVASVSMTLGNKALMMGPLAANKHLVLVFQNAISVTVLNGGAVAGLISFERVDRRQLLFYVWDAAMLVVQLFTSFVALQHLPVATTTVVRALAIPLVAWSELLVMGTRLPASKQASAAVVMAGALLYAREDLVGQSSSQSATGAPPPARPPSGCRAATASRALAAGYLFALFNLLAYTSNALLDRVMMSSSKQSAAGMAMYTQALSIPICLIEGGAASALGAAAWLSPRTRPHNIYRCTLPQRLPLLCCGAS